MLRRFGIIIVIVAVSVVVWHGHRASQTERAGEDAKVSVGVSEKVTPAPLHITAQAVAAPATSASGGDSVDAKSFEDNVENLELNTSDALLKQAFGADRSSVIYLHSLLASRHVANLPGGAPRLENYNAAMKIWLDAHADEAFDALASAQSRLNVAEFSAERSALIAAAATLKGKTEDANALALAELTTHTFEIRPLSQVRDGATPYAGYVNAVMDTLLSTESDAGSAAAHIVSIFENQTDATVRESALRAFQQRFPDLVSKLDEDLDGRGFPVAANSLAQ